MELQSNKIEMTKLDSAERSKFYKHVNNGYNNQITILLAKQELHGNKMVSEGKQ